MITAHSEDVNLPPGRYQGLTILRALESCKNSKRKEYYQRKCAKRGYTRMMVKKILLDAAIDDPDELQELWIRPADLDMLHE